MIGTLITDKNGKPVQGEKLTPSKYEPPKEVLDLFAKCQIDYQRAYALQHRPFDEFDGMSLLERAKKDQQTFGAFVGAEYLPSQKRWRWRGRKNTARNKLISILAHMIAGMLYPLVNAQNKESEPDKMSARVMRIIVEDHLKKANYEIKFLYMILSALVNPAVLVEVLYLEAYQRIKEELPSGEMQVTEAIDLLLTGLNLNIVAIDQLLLSDFFVNDIQKQPLLIRVNRLPWDTARKIYAGRYYQGDKDLFDYVQPGKTRVFIAGQENATLFDVDWTEADANSVQVLTFYYRDEDLELDWVGGVGMFNYTNPMNSNRFKHRRMSLIEDEWKSIPIYPFAKSFYEPIDPTGRFAYGKSGAFKEYWDDASINHAYRLLQDGMTLEVIKPLFISGVSKVDDIVIAPGAVAGMPANANVTPWSMSPNLKGAMDVLMKNEQDMSESTQDRIMSGNPTPGVTATQSIQAQNQARLQLGVFGIMTADLIKQIGELVVDCVIQHTLAGELDMTVPEALQLKYRTILAKTKDKGRDVTNRIYFKSDLVGRPMTDKQKDDYEWKLWDDKGGEDQVIYHVNPHKFARLNYSMTVDPDQIVNHAMGNDRQQKLLKYQMLTQQFVYPFTDQKAVADDVIEEFSDGDPDRFKTKGNAGANSMMSAITGQGGEPQPGQPTPPVPSPMGAPAVGQGPMASFQSKVT